MSISDWLNLGMLMTPGSSRANAAVTVVDQPTLSNARQRSINAGQRRIAQNHPITWFCPVVRSPMRLIRLQKETLSYHCLAPQCEYLLAPQYEQSRSRPLCGSAAQFFLRARRRSESTLSFDTLRETWFIPPQLLRLTIGAVLVVCWLASHRTTSWSGPARGLFLIRALGITEPYE